MFTRADEVGWAQSNAFKKAFSIDVDIEFIGVWGTLVFFIFSLNHVPHTSLDTVNSVGLIPRRLPFTTSNTIVRTFRHAVSLDERRAKFKANLWNRPNGKESTLGTSTTIASTDVPAIKPDVVPVTPIAKAKDPKRPATHKQHSTLRQLERQNSHRHGGQPTDIKEVWFSGCHCGTSIEHVFLLLLTFDAHP